MSRAQNVYFPFFVRRKWEKDNQIIPYLKISSLLLDKEKNKEKKYLVFYNRKNLEKIKQIKANRYIPFVEPTNDYSLQTTFVIDFDIKQDSPEINAKILEGFSTLHSILNGKCLLIRSASGTGWHIIFVTNGNIEPKNYQQLQKDIISNLFAEIEEYIDYNASLSKRQGFYHLSYFPEWIERGYVNITKKDQGKKRNFWTSKITLDPFEIHSLQDNLVPFNKRDCYRLDSDIIKTLQFINRANEINNQSIQNQYINRFINLIGEISESKNFQLKNLLAKYNLAFIESNYPNAANIIQKDILSIARYVGYYRAINEFLCAKKTFQESNDIHKFMLSLKDINFNKKVNEFFSSNEKDKILFFESEITLLNNLFIDCFDISLVNNPSKSYEMLDSYIEFFQEKNQINLIQSIKRFIKFIFEIKNGKKTNYLQSNFEINEDSAFIFLDRLFTEDFTNLSISKHNQQSLKKIWREEKQWLLVGFKNLIAAIYQLKVAQNNIFIDIGLEDFKKYWNTHERKAIALRQLIMPRLSKDINEYKPHWKRRGFMVDWHTVSNFCVKNFTFTPKYLADKMGNGNTWTVIRSYAKPLVANYGLYEACKIFNEAIWLSEAKNKKQRIREFALFARKISKQLQEQKCRLQAQTVV